MLRDSATRSAAIRSGAVPAAPWIGAKAVYLNGDLRAYSCLEGRMAESCAVVREASRQELPGLIRRYYDDPAVRERMYEFLGGTGPRKATAMYIAGTAGYSDYHVFSDPCDLSEYLEGALEVDRSLWDQDSLIADIDLEYHNFDYPAAPWLEPQRAFQLQQPVLDATLQILARAGIVPLTLVSGRGFHLVWAIRRNSLAFRRLSALGHVPASLQARYAQPCSPNGLHVDPELGYAFAGLGQIMEFVGHRVLAASRETCVLSVQPAAIEVGPGTHGREIVSFDLSEYGDPLHTRHVRLPFSTYLKPRQLEWMFGEAQVHRLLPIFEIPLDALNPVEAIAAMRNPDAVLDIARRTSVIIPNASHATDSLLDQYEHSELALFHQQFYTQIPQEEDQASADSWPPCLQFLMENPNDWLLKPAALQHVARVLMALGWSPSSIARRICSSYSKDCDWGDTWVRLDPCSRAIFYTRLFTGMIATGIDKLMDFNCVSHQEKGYCVVPECSSNLTAYRDQLLQRRPK
jgi:hypothetical protein